MSVGVETKVINFEQSLSMSASYGSSKIWSKEETEEESATRENGVSSAVSIIGPQAGQLTYSQFKHENFK